MAAYTLPDLHADVAAAELTSATTLSDAFRYDGYGQTAAAWPTGTSSGPAQPYRYQGRLDISPDASQPVYDLGARFYQPSVGVFTQLDAVSGSAQDTLSLNRYLYAEANPATLIDPDGHMAISGTDASTSYRAYVTVTPSGKRILHTISPVKPASPKSTRSPKSASNAVEQAADSSIVFLEKVMERAGENYLEKAAAQSWWRPLSKAGSWLVGKSLQVGGSALGMAGSAFSVGTGVADEWNSEADNPGMALDTPIGRIEWQRGLRSATVGLLKTVIGGGAASLSAAGCGALTENPLAAGGCGVGGWIVGSDVGVRAGHFATWLEDRAIDLVHGAVTYLTTPPSGPSPLDPYNYVCQMTHTCPDVSNVS